MSVVTLISKNQQLQEHFQKAYEGTQSFRFSGMLMGVEEIADRPDKLAPFDLTVVDLGPERDKAIAVISKLRKSGVRGAIVTISDDLEQADVRALLHLRAADWLSMVDGRMPTKGEIIEASHKAIRENPKVTLSTASARCLSFLPAAGGVGQTVIAGTLALLMAQRKNTNRRTCLVDLNFQYSKIADYLDVAPSLDLATIESAPERLDRTLMEVMLTRHDSGLAVLAAGRHRTIEGSRHKNVVPHILNVICEMFDDVVVDLPAMWQPWTVDVLAGSDEIYIVTDFSVPGIRQARELHAALPDVLAQDLYTRVIVNKYKSKFLGGNLRKNDATAALGNAIAGFVSDGGDRIQDALNLGQPTC